VVENAVIERLIAGWSEAEIEEQIERLQVLAGQY